MRLSLLLKRNGLYTYKPRHRPTWKERLEAARAAKTWTTTRTLFRDYDHLAPDVLIKHGFLEELLEFTPPPRRFRLLERLPPYEKYIELRDKTFTHDLGEFVEEMYREVSELLLLIRTWISSWEHRFPYLTCRSSFDVVYETETCLGNCLADSVVIGDAVWKTPFIFLPCRPPGKVGYYSRGRRLRLNEVKRAMLDLIYFCENASEPEIRALADRFSLSFSHIEHLEYPYPGRSFRMIKGETPSSPL